MIVAMGLLDKMRAWEGEGVPARAVVIVNKGNTSETGTQAHISLVRIKVRRLPNGPEGTLRSSARGYQADLITSGMEIPVRCDPDTGEPKGLDQEGLDEAIGRYYHQLQPTDYATWEEALADKIKIHKQSGQIIAPIRWELEAWRDTA